MNLHIYFLKYHLNQVSSAGRGDWKERNFTSVGGAGCYYVGRLNEGQMAKWNVIFFYTCEKCVGREFTIAGIGRLQIKGFYFCGKDLMRRGGAYCERAGRRRAGRFIIGWVKEAG